MSKNRGGKGFNKQGLRDLNSLPGKSTGIRLEMPPEPGNDCPHPDDKIIVTGDELNFKCTKCGNIIGEV